MKKPKVIAFYLPQFHAIPENDEWWGKGFTEWVNTKKAKPLFEGHQQPKTPLNDNYYCLLDAETQEWQAELAEKYGVYGFCYYHYWFNGKMLLEKPMENMLNNKNIKLPFCISWANEPWARTWDGKNKEVLMSQVYGEEKEWKEHFEFHAKCFLDDSTKEERDSFRKFAKTLIKADNEVSEQEHDFYDILKTIWKIK